MGLVTPSGSESCVALLSRVEFQNGLPRIALPTSGAMVDGMTQPAEQNTLSRSTIGVLVAVGFIGVAQLLFGRSFFPGLHTILDTGMFLMSGMLALLFWDIGVHRDQAFPKRIAAAFLVTSLSECIHAFVSIEWTGTLEFLTRAADTLRPTTWPPSAHLLPIGLACSVWLLRTKSRDILGFAAALLLLGIGFFAAFRWLPTYTTPVVFGITRPALIFVPVLWSFVGWTCWRLRNTDRMVGPLALMSVVLFLSSTAMLFSSSPHDSQAMVAHLGRVGGYLIVLLLLLQMASADMLERVRAERNLARLNEDLEERVRERTAELANANKKVLAQLERLNLLHQITRSIGGREDLRSIYQVVLRSLEDHLEFDFGCICDYDSATQELTVVHVGVRGQALAFELAMGEHARVSIDANGLSRCVRGTLVYEPDIAEVQMPFPQRLARGGLRSLVAAPLLVESKVFGVFLAARREAASFTSGECEFLRQLSEHVALAAHQTQLYGALQQAYDDLRQTQQTVMQQERLRALGQMASGIAHDINNAISPMALYTEIVLDQDANLSPQTRKHLEMIQRAVDDVAKTVARMREFYRQREPQLTLAPVDLNALLQQVIDLTRARWSDMPQQQGIVIKMKPELAPNLPAVMGVESELREALINVVFNAVDAMPGGGTLTLRTRVTEVASATDKPNGLRQVHAEVVDTGAGMDEETQRRCMEPFFTTKGERGTGLGLAMVYGTVRRHTADMEIESAVGQGTIIRLTFGAATAIVAGSVTSKGRRRALPRMRILIVDDDPLVLKSLQDALEAEGHLVVAANGGQEGIATFQEALGRNEGFSIVITDLGMPYVDGRKVSGAVKTAAPYTSVILLTGWGQRLVEQGDVPAHVDYVLSKPPKLAELRDTLALCVGNAALEKEGATKGGIADA